MGNAATARHPLKQRAVGVAGQLRLRPCDERLMDVMTGNSSANGIDIGSNGDGLDLPCRQRGIVPWYLPC